METSSPFSHAGLSDPEPQVCTICAQHKSGLIPAALIRPSILAEILKERPDFSTESYICAEDLNRFRSKYIEGLMVSEKGELSVLDQDVLESLRQHELLVSDVNEEFERKFTFGEGLSDKIAAFGGSWTFIIMFFCVMGVWVAANSVALFFRPFDPYPFILLNLVLSLLAALQAPIIMMSQNRQEAKDRVRAENDYRINLKAELEIRHLHEKIDHLLSRQWERLVDIQQIQIELMSEMVTLKEQKE